MESFCDIFVYSHYPEHSTIYPVMCYRQGHTSELTSKKVHLRPTHGSHRETISEIELRGTSNVFRRTVTSRPVRPILNQGPSAPPRLGVAEGF